MQKRIQKETGNNCLKRIIVAFLAVIMMTTMLHPQMVQAATGTENGIFIKSKNNEAPVFEAGKKKNWNRPAPQPSTRSGSRNMRKHIRSNTAKSVVMELHFTKKSV